VVRTSFEAIVLYSSSIASSYAIILSFSFYAYLSSSLITSNAYLSSSNIASYAYANSYSFSSFCLVDEFDLS